ncbi:GNAT family N-acetyltransferase [Corynebacterium sp. AOP36-E1-14]|uniref:GNAT family N-acetyltransferase n=1 Tax=unclassified Corynebacterium TaxID=2624378 RepID=UPI00403492A8
MLATLRILTEEQSLRIGRVVADKHYRGTGIARELFTYALNQCSKAAPDKKIVLDAQAPLEEWYESFGFTRAGEDFLEDGIPHVPMLK